MTAASVQRKGAHGFQRFVRPSIRLSVRTVLPLPTYRSFFSSLPLSTSSSSRRRSRSRSRSSSGGSRPASQEHQQQQHQQEQRHGISSFKPASHKGEKGGNVSGMRRWTQWSGGRRANSLPIRGGRSSLSRGVCRPSVRSPQWGPGRRRRRRMGKMDPSISRNQPSGAVSPGTCHSRKCA
jgi:hypothetical protein